MILSLHEHHLRCERIYQINKNFIFFKRYLHTESRIFGNVATKRKWPYSFNCSFSFNRKTNSDAIFWKFRFVSFICKLMFRKEKSFMNGTKRNFKNLVPDFRSSGDNSRFFSLIHVPNHKSKMHEAYVFPFSVHYPFKCLFCKIHKLFYLLYYYNKLVRHGTTIDDKNLSRFVDFA